jgi:hypothetical protein
VNPIRKLVEGDNPIETSMEGFGWSLIETGGGCTAFSKQYGDVELLITDDAEAPTSMDQAVTFGIYGDGSQIIAFGNMTVQQVVDFCKYIVA